MVKMIKYIWILCVALFSYGQVSYAHSDSQSLITFNASSAQNIQLLVELDVFDLAQALNLDDNQNQEVTWGELNQHANEVFSYVNQNLVFSNADEACVISNTGKINGIQKRLGKTYAEVELKASCNTLEDNTAVNFSLFSDTVFNHRGVFKVQYEQEQTLQILRQGENTVSLIHDTSGGFSDFVYEGVTHIFLGYDHMAFLLLLLLPLALLTLIRDQFLKAAGVVTAFTLAHSITLTLASTGQVNLPSSLVEASIAASIVLAALHNIFLKRMDSNWKLAFVFGLIHGFGFASALSELTSNQGINIFSLVGFNLGVELGQLMIVMLILPIFILLAKQKLISRHLVPVVSGGLGLLGVFWLVERLA